MSVPSISDSPSLLNELYRRNLFQKLNVLIAAHLIIEIEDFQSNISFPQLLNHPLKELLKRAVNLDGLYQILNRLQVPIEYDSRIIGGFDLIIG
jgi:hypothetical protein